jgi:hypothetical protein
MRQDLEAGKPLESSFQWHSDQATSVGRPTRTDNSVFTALEFLDQRIRSPRKG